MKDYAKKEEKILNKIDKRIDELNNNLFKMDDADGKVKHFFEQEKALHDIKSIIRSENKLDKDEAKDKADSIKKDVDVIKTISDKIDDLEERLNALNDDDSKIESYFEQKKVIDDIKKIVKEALN